MSAATHGAVFYSTEGFEANRFHTGFTNSFDPSIVGNLRGQDAPINMWRESTTNPNGDGQGASTGTAVVENKAGGVFPDLQDVKVTRTQYDDRWSPQFNYIPTPTDYIEHIDWSMKVTQTTTDLTKFGPFFGVEANDDHTGPALQVGSLGVDATTGEVLFLQNGFGLNITDNDDHVAFDTYNNFDLALNYNTKTYDISVNGSLLQSGISFFNGSATRLTDTDISALQASDPADSNQAGVAYFDNFNVVPEPASLGLVAVAALSLVRRRRSI